MPTWETTLQARRHDGPIPFKETVVYEEYEVQFVDVVAEKNVGRWRPDLTATLKNGAKLHIEVKVTHAVEDEKAKALDNVLEVDLSRLAQEDVLNLARFKKQVLKKAHRYWYRCSLYNDLKRILAAKARLQALSEQSKVDAQRKKLLMSVKPNVKKKKRAALKRALRLSGRRSSRFWIHSIT